MRQLPVEPLLAAARIQWRAAPLATLMSLAFAVATSSTGALAAWVSKLLIDELSRGHSADATRALWLAGGGALAASGAVAFWHGSHYADIVVRSKITLAVESALFRRVADLDQLRPFEDPAFHAQLRQAAEAARAAPQQVASLLQAAVRTAVTIGSLIGVVLIVWPAMAGLLVLLVVAGVLAQLNRVRYETQMLRDLLNGQIWHESYRSLLLEPRAAKELQLFGTASAICTRMLARLEISSQIERRRERRAALGQGGIELVAAAIAAIGMVVVVRRVLSGGLALGDVALFSGAVAGMHGALTGLVTQMGDVGPRLIQFRSYLELVSAVPSPGKNCDAPKLSKAIELRDVWFRYSPEAPWVLRGVNLTVLAGRTIGLVGLNGAGKSTLVKLLMRFYDAERGAILWDGIDLRDIDPKALRKRISATFQDFCTYDLSAADNIGLGDADAMEDLPRIREAARLAGIDDLLLALPQGYQTQLSRIISEEGVAQRGGLSGGQWQRLALARSLLRRSASLMILDEPTSGLDPEAEHEVHALLHAHSAGDTRILVSHRLSALRPADSIAVLADGVVTELGTHDELMKRCGSYAQMFCLQAAGYQDRGSTEGVA